MKSTTTNVKTRGPKMEYLKLELSRRKPREVCLRSPQYHHHKLHGLYMTTVSSEDLFWATSGGVKIGVDHERTIKWQL